MKTTKKILYITLRSDFGGGPYHVDMLIRNLSNTFTIFCAAPLEKPFGYGWKEILGNTKFFELPHRSLSIVRFLKLLAFLRREKIDIVHSHGKGGGVYGRLLKIFMPKLYIIFSFHGLHTSMYSLFTRKIYILFERFLNLFTNFYINVSFGEQEECLNYKLFKKQKSIVIHNALNKLEPNEVQKDELRKFLHLPKDKFIVISAIRFNYQKNYRAMMEIANRLKLISDLEFILIGDGEEKKKAKELIEKSKINNVILAGYKKNIDEYLLAADVYLSTSLWEGLPYSLIEAARAGLPIVASNVTGNNEVAVNDYNGYLFDLNDLDSAADRIKHLYNSKSEVRRLGDNSKKQFENKFVLNNMITKIKDVYLRIQ